MLEKIKKKILISIAAAGLVYLAFTIYADFNDVAGAFRTFNWFLLPLLLALSFTNYIFRFIKWDYYLRLLSVPIKKMDSFFIFMSGLIMSVTPGKFGEVLKSYLVKQISGTSISKTAPIIFVERITDFVSLILIAVVGAFSFDYGKVAVIGVGIFFLFLLIILSNKNIALPIISLFEKINFLKKHISNIHNAYESSYIMLQPKPLFYMTIVSLGSWFFECLGYFLILNSFNLEVSILWSSFSYAFATIIGAISMLPGGLGVTEGSLTFLLVEKGAANEVAVASTFIIRAVTLWFAVLVGVISVTLYQRRFGKIILETIQETNLGEMTNEKIQKN